MPDQLHVYHNDYEWIVASSPDDAVAEGMKFSGCTREDYCPDGENLFRELPDDGMLTISQEEQPSDGDLPNGATVAVSERGMFRITATTRAWIDKNGRGFLCATDW